jgi:glucokinase
LVVIASRYDGQGNSRQVQTVCVTVGERALALDIGGTKIASGWVGPDGAITARAEVATPAGDAEQIWSAVEELVMSRVGAELPSAVGVGCGGPLRLELGEVSPVNLPGWRDFPLLARVQALFPAARIRLHNDAVAMALGEAWLGAGRGSEAFLGVVVSTGVGAGIVRSGRALDGATGNAGHLGHVVVDPAGPPCGCGGIGCLEAIARGPAVVQYAIDSGWRIEGRPDGRALAAAARGGDGHAIVAIDRAGRALGVALASAASLLELDRAAVGGGFAIGAGDLLMGPALEAFALHARMDYAARCEIVSATLGNDAGLVGAAALVLQEDSGQ